MFSIKNIFHITEPKQSILDKDIYKIFRLPIEFLPSENIFTLNNNVASDLEMIAPPVQDISGQIIQSNTMYNYLLTPQNKFAVTIIPEWSKYFTNNIEFLKHSQNVIDNIDYIIKDQDSLNCDEFLDFWKDCKQDNLNFMERYSFIEWDIARYLNESPGFLQMLSFTNMASPILSFFIPIFFLIFPFIILKLKGIPIDMNTYFNTLKTIAKNHFIGIILRNTENISWTSLFYILGAAGLYFLQIYQNYRACVRFYNNISRINTHINNLKQYLTFSIHKMDLFIDLNSNYHTYSDFCNLTRYHSDQLKVLLTEIESIKTFKPTFSKLTEIGYLLKSFYRLHTNEFYENALRYSVGFNGFLFNLKGIRTNILSKNINRASFDTNETTTMKGMYYPALIDESYVKNDCSFHKNIIITGPNASGKTTILKSTSINIILSQQFGVGFYDSCVINPYTYVHSYLNIPDTSGRDSLFQAESRRCKEIIDIIDQSSHNDRHLCIFDELYSGTNPDEATKSAYALLLYLSEKKNVDFALTTHYHKLCKKIKKKHNMKNYMMDVITDQDSIINYTFLLKKGISNIKGGVTILEEMKYPKFILNCIYKQNKKSK